MKKRKILLTILISLIFGILIFYFWGSSGNFEEKEYALINDYQKISLVENDSTYRIISYNIGYLSGMTNNLSVKVPRGLYEDNMKKVQKVFSALSPDIIAFQELDFGSNRSYYVNQIDELAQSLNYRYAAEVVNWDKKYVPFPYFPLSVNFGEMLSGQGIISRFPIHSQKRIVLEKPKSNPFYRNAFYLDRLAQVIETEIEGKPFIIINTHLEAFDWETRRNQSKVVLELYRQYAAQYPTILIGDFNGNIKGYSVKQIPSIQLFMEEKGMKHASPTAELNTETTFTFPADKPIEQIDFIFFNEDKIESLNYRVVKEMGTPSDHLPILMDFKLVATDSLVQLK